MKTEKLHVNSIQEAIEILEKKYGSNAIILSSKVIKKNRLGIIPFFKKKILEVTIGIQEDSDFSKELQKETELYREIEKIKQTISEYIRSGEKNLKIEQEEKYSPKVKNIYDKLVQKGLNKEVAEKIIEDACGFDIDRRVYDFKEDEYTSLKESFRKNIQVQRNFFINPPKVVALVGPTGVGKTTTIAKLAYLLKKEGKKIGIISLDSFRLGAFEQLKGFADILEIPFRLADTPKAFGVYLLEMEDKDCILVDTAGRSHYDVIRLKELEKFFKVSDVDVYLTLAANLSEIVMYEAVMQFGIFSIKGLVFCKMDETPQPGVVFNVAYRTQYPILCFTTGQNLPDDIEVANYDYMVRLFLEEENEVKSTA